MEILREWERVTLPAPRPRVSVEAMAGRWTKTNDKAQWIGGLDVRVDGDDLLVRLAGGAVAGGLGHRPHRHRLCRVADQRRRRGRRLRRALRVSRR
jgi:hypothetical protein